jgi:hypothetical protein
MKALPSYVRSGAPKAESLEIAEIRDLARTTRRNRVLSYFKGTK